jgi:hypothetical protein
MRQVHHWQWHLDEMFVRINGETHYLWRAVVHEGEVHKCGGGAVRHASRPFGDEKYLTSSAEIVRNRPARTAASQGRRLSLAASLAAGALLALSAASAQAADAICYNCPPEWADWASMLQAIETELGISIPHDNKNSGQTLTQLLAERGNPVADVAYFGVTFGTQAAEAGVLEAYEPIDFDDVPEGLKDADDRWFTIHQGTLGLFVNVDALGDSPVPACFEDLLSPEYSGMVGYLDPSSAFVGYAGALAVILRCPPRFRR